MSRVLKRISILWLPLLLSQAGADDPNDWINAMPAPRTAEPIAKTPHMSPPGGLPSLQHTQGLGEGDDLLRIQTVFDTARPGEVYPLVVYALNPLQHTCNGSITASLPDGGFVEDQPEFDVYQRGAEQEVALFAKDGDTYVMRGKRDTVQDLLVEAYFKEWQTETTNFLTIPLLFTQPGKYRVLVRATLARRVGDEYVVQHTYPPRGTLDQQQLPCAEHVIEVRASGDTFEPPVAAADRKGVVTADTLNFRSEPSLDSNVITVLTEGTLVNLVQATDEWLQVEAPDGKLGWAHAAYVVTGTAVERARSIMHRDKTDLAGVWLGTWETTSGENSDFTLIIDASASGGYTAIGRVNGWTGTEAFEGSMISGVLHLTGTGVIENTRPASQYELDELDLMQSEVGLRLDGKWSDQSGASGEIILRFADVATD